MTPCWRKATRHSGRIAGCCSATTLTRSWSRRMPLYEYVCDVCGHRFEVIQKFSDPAPEACPSCGKGPLVRQFSSPAIQFKGSGFYITDYTQKEKGQAERKAGESGGGGTSEVSKSDGAKSDSAKSEGAKTDTAKTDTAKTDSGKTESSSKSDTT